MENKVRKVVLLVFMIIVLILILRQALDTSHWLRKEK